MSAQHNEPRDAIAELVDWQLAGKPAQYRQCRACRCSWTSHANECPECGVRQASA